jgi:hypothetical protein
MEEFTKLVNFTENRILTYNQSIFKMIDGHGVIQLSQLKDLSFSNKKSRSRDSIGQEIITELQF